MLCTRLDHCRLCSSKRLTLAFALAPTPPANAFVPKSSLAESEQRFPLDVFFCEDCFHVQILDVVSPEVLFGNYVYVSGTSPTFVNHFKKYSEYVRAQFELKPSSFIFELGSNDGTLLRFFKDAGMKVLGVDPARAIAEKATAEGIPTLPLFFGEKEATHLAATHGQADVVIANNVFAHIADLEDTAKAVRTILKQTGVFVFEVSYLADVIEKTLFDTIYHEHLDYHSVGPLRQFFSRLGMEIFDVQKVDSHGGSLRGFVQKAGGPHRVNRSVQEFMDAERRMGLYSAQTFRDFSRQISELGLELGKRLKSLKASGKKIAGFGAPAKATTLMHHFSIGPEVIDFIVDDSPLKQGLFTPGLHVPVLPSSAMYQQKPDYVLILAWNFADSIVQKHQEFIKQGGHFIVPLPKLKEV